MPTTEQLIRLLVAIAVLIVLVWLIVWMVNRLDNDTAAMIDTLVTAAVGTLDGGGKGWGRW